MCSYRLVIVAAVVLAPFLAACGGSDDTNEGGGGGGGRTSAYASPRADLSGSSHLAYVSRDGIEVVDLETGTRQTTNVATLISGGVTASDDGHIAFLTEPDDVNDAIDVVVLDRDGEQTARARVGFQGFTLNGASLSRDGTRYAFGAYARDDDGTFARVYTGRLDAEQVEYINVTPYTTDDNVSQSFAAATAWTSDGRLVVTGANAIFLEQSVGGDFEIIGPDDLSQPGNPCVSPDDRYIVFDQARGANIGDGGSSFRAIWSLDTQSGEITQLTRGVIEQYNATISKDGTTLLFGDSSPVAVGNVGAFDRTYLQALPFTQRLVDISDDDASVRDSDNTPLRVFGRAAVF